MIYTCPMHPQIEQDHPGNCPICGMTLEPKGISAYGAEDLELAAMSLSSFSVIANALRLRAVPSERMMLEGAHFQFHAG
jgi:Heavy metal binding domain